MIAMRIEAIRFLLHGITHFKQALTAQQHGDHSKDERMKRRVAMGPTYAPYEIVLRLEQVAQGRGLSYCQHLAVRWRSKEVSEGEWKKRGKEGR
jgi:hypothetical protein